VTFLAPGRLFGLLVLLPMIAAQVVAFLKGRRDIALLGRPSSSDSARTLYAVKSFFAALTFNLFVVFAVFALADPTWGERPVEEDRDDLDVVVCLDISRSMLATDVDPSRLARSLSLVRSVSRQLPAARFALLVFKGDATMLLPLTEDLNALETVLDGISPDLVSTPGTDIEKGLSTAIEAFPPGTNAHRAILLVSDGESLDGTPDRPAGVARSLGIPVLTVVAGTAEGATLVARDGTTVMDSAGRPVVSRASETVLRGIADATGTITVGIADLDAAATVADGLRAHAERREAAGFRLVPVRRYALFIGAALAALALYLAVGVIRWQRAF
jgi:Ca-activated chloride channel family protein